MYRRYIRTRACARVISQNFFPLTAKKRRFFLRNVLHFLTREEYLFTYRVERDRQRKRKESASEKDIKHTRKVVCTFLSFLPPERYMCAD